MSIGTQLSTMFLAEAFFYHVFDESILKRFIERLLEMGKERYVGWAKQDFYHDASANMELKNARSRYQLTRQTGDILFMPLHAF